MTTTQSTRQHSRIVAYVGAGVVGIALVATLQTVNESIHSIEIPACAQEDSPGPCRWDASTMGNGIGLSYTVDAQQVVHYVSGK